MGETFECYPEFQNCFGCFCGKQLYSCLKNTQKDADFLFCFQTCITDCIDRAWTKFNQYLKTGQTNSDDTASEKN